MPHILIADDNEIDRLFLASLVEKNFGCPTLEASTGQAALAWLKEDTDDEIAAVLLDLSMPDMDGHIALPKMLALRPNLQIIAVTGSQELSDAINVLRAGATDYLTKPIDADLFRSTLTKALNVYGLRQEIHKLRQKEAPRTGFSDLVGQSPALQTCLKLGNRAAMSDITVFITGESGTGKELLARALHTSSVRCTKPFVAVNCGAIPKDLVESTLFGHKKGAFTGAFADAPGKFYEADGGTLFLDEIGELPLEAQVKLLRALQERVIEPVGASKSVPINIRIIAATNRDPMEAVRRGHLREDLYYRLNAFPIHMPPLRDRKGDISLLASHFLRHYSSLENKSITGFTKEAETWMELRPWPGNIRELENTIFRAVLLADHDRIGVEHLSVQAALELKPTGPKRGKIPDGMSIQLLDSSGNFKRMDVLQREVEQAALAFHDNNTTLAARQLGIGKSTLYKHLGE